MHNVKRPIISNKIEDYQKSTNQEKPGNRPILSWVPEGLQRKINANTPQIIPWNRKEENPC